MLQKHCLWWICISLLLDYCCASCPENIDRSCICEENIDGIHILCRQYQEDFNSLLVSLNGLRVGRLTVVGSKWPIINTVFPITLTSLKIINCSVHTVTDHAFLPMADSLMDLVLANNSIQHFPVFGSLYRLISLNLNNNQLTSIDDDVLKGISHLRQLRLEGNAIKSISRTAFISGKQNIELLDLSGNKLTTVPSQLISNSKNLKYLDFSENYFSTIASLDFRNLPELIELRLNNNMLTKIEPMGLKNIPKLRQLYLRNNLLTDLDDVNLVNHFGLLETLDLSNNAFKKVPNVCGHQSLQFLIMNGNKIAAINKATFAFAKELRFISLEGNQITTIADNSFVAVDKLAVILLDNNHLRRLEAKSFDGAKQLQQLSLRNNSLTAINPETMSAFPELQMLDLSCNRLNAIPNVSVRKLKKLSILNLSNNSITTLDCGITEIDEIYLSGNPLQCDKKLKCLRRYLTQNKFVAGSKTNDGVYCIEPNTNSKIMLLDFLLRINESDLDDVARLSSVLSSTKLNVSTKKPDETSAIIKQALNNGYSGNSDSNIPKAPIENKTYSDASKDPLERLNFLRVLLPPKYDIRMIPVIQAIMDDEIPQFSKIPYELKVHLLKNFGQFLTEVFKEGQEITDVLRRMQLKTQKKVQEGTLNYEPQPVNEGTIKHGLNPNIKDHVWYSLVSAFATAKTPLLMYLKIIFPVLVTCLSAIIIGIVTLSKLLREESNKTGRNSSESFLSHCYSDSTPVPGASLLRFSTNMSSSGSMNFDNHSSSSAEVIETAQNSCHI